MQKYKKIIITFFIIEQIALVYLILWQDKKLKDFTKKPKEQIHIKDIAEIWTQFNTNSNDKPLLETTIYNERQNIANINESLLSVANYTYAETQIFVNDIIKPIYKKISSGHLKTIIRLLNLLEQNKHCPSVVNFAKTEPNIIYNDREIVTLDKKTKYDIYENISVYRHSLNVAKKAVEILQQEKGSKIGLIAKVIITALAHDIGKIERYEIREQKRQISFEERKRMPHQNISSMILYDSFKDCPDLKEIADIVARHHDGFVDKTDTLLKILMEADSKTRSDELHRYKIGEDICDLLNVAPKRQEVVAPQKPAPQTTPQSTPQVETPSENNLFSKDFSDEFSNKTYPSIDNLVLMGVEFDKDLAENDYTNLDSLLKKDLKGDELNCYTKEKGFFVLIHQQRDKSKVFNLAYDIIQRINKSDFKDCFVGFVMAKEALSASDMVEKANLALDEAKKSKAIVDFKDIKNRDKDEKMVISDTPADEVKDESPADTQISEPEIENPTKDETEAKKDEVSLTQDEISNELIQSATNDEDDAFKQIQKLTSQIKAINPANEKDFDISRLEQRIFKELATKINTFSSEGGFYINSISFKKFVLFSKRCLIATLAEILQNDEDIEKKVNYFIRYYRNHEDENKRYIWFVGVEKGFYESIYHIGQDKQTPVKTSFVPFEAKMTFGLDVHQLENSKNNSELSNYKVWEFNKERKK